MWQETVKKNFKHKLDKDEILVKECPYCGNSKHNLQISISKAVYHCWACDKKGKIEKFFKDQNLEFDRTGWKSSATKKESTPEKLDLTGFVSLFFSYPDHEDFLLSRGIEPDDVNRYDLMITHTGRYKGKLIIPLKEGHEFVYFVSRDMFPKGRYLNPVINKKEFLLYYLGNENSLRLYLVEGAFDAISVNKLGFSVAMLLGSSISKEQIAKIKRIGFSDVVVCLDGDLKKKAIEMHDRLTKANIKTKIVLIPGNDDPNELYVADKDYLKKLLMNPRDVTVRDKVGLILNK